MSTYKATAADWPPTLNPNPAVQPPKWDWQLATPVKLNPDTSIKIYDIDMFENEKDTTVQTPHSNGYKAICYLDGGSWRIGATIRTISPKPSSAVKYSGFPDESGSTSATSTRTNRPPAPSSPKSS